VTAPAASVAKMHTIGEHRLPGGLSAGGSECDLAFANTGPNTEQIDGTGRSFAMPGPSWSSGWSIRPYLNSDHFAVGTSPIEVGVFNGRGDLR